MVTRNIFLSGVALFVVLMASQKGLSAEKRPLPTANKLPIIAESFCLGAPDLLKKTKQPIADEMALFCTGTTPTALLEDLIATAYDGTNPVNYREIAVGISPTVPNFVDVRVAYSLRVKQSAVKILRSEEALMTSAGKYEGKDLKIYPDFGPPPGNSGDSDTAFAIKQRTLRDTGAGQFDDLSLHNLQLYRILPNNFDFLLAARTLNPDPTKNGPLFQKATVLRLAMTDPKDPANYGLEITLMNFLVSDQKNQADLVKTIFTTYIKEDILNVYKYHNKP